MIKGKLIKVCGMREPDNIRDVEALEEVDLIGFVFHPRSPRRVDEIPSFLPARARRVGVFVDAAQEEIFRTAHRFGLHAIQLHGNESPACCQALRQRGWQVIKAFGIAEEKDLKPTADYDECCDLLLFDTRTPAYGGSGKAFDRRVLRAYEGRTPFLLSGGISPDSIDELHSFEHSRCAGYDLNSRFELYPGRKNTESLRRFLCALGS